MSLCFSFLISLGQGLLVLGVDWFEGNTWREFIHFWVKNAELRPFFLTLLFERTLTSLDCDVISLLMSSSKTLHCFIYSSALESFPFSSFLLTSDHRIRLVFPLPPFPFWVLFCSLLSHHLGAYRFSGLSNLAYMVQLVVII